LINERDGYRAVKTCTLFPVLDLDPRVAETAALDQFDKATACAG
jgi:hypothetical protein